MQVHATSVARALHPQKRMEVKMKEWKQYKPFEPKHPVVRLELMVRRWLIVAGVLMTLVGICWLLAEYMGWS